MTTVSPFARSSVFDEPRLGGREQTVSALLCSAVRTRPDAESTDRGDVQRPGELPGDRGAESADARWATRARRSSAHRRAGFGRKMYTDYEILCKVRYGGSAAWRD